MRSWIEWVVRHRKVVLTLTFVLTLLLMLPLRSLQVVIDPDEALPQTHPYIVANNEVERVFGNKLTTVIGVHILQGSVLDEANIAKIRRITERLKKVPGVVEKSIVSLTSPEVKTLVMSPAGPVSRPIVDGASTTRETIETNLKSAPVYEGLLISSDRRTAQIVAEFKKIPEGFGKVQAELHAAVDSEKDSNTEIWVGGVPTFLSLLERYSQRMAFLFPLAVLVIGLIHYEAFRTIQALILPLVTALLAVIWSLGVLGVSGQPVDVFNASTPILILAVAAGHAVQILKRYYEEFAKLRERSDSSDLREMNRNAVVNSLASVGPVMVVAGIVAAIGFFSLVVFEIKSIRVFGVFTGVGVLSTLVLELSFIPALRAMLPPPGKREFERESARTIWDRIVDGFYGIATRRRAGLSIVVAILIVFFGIGAFRLKIDNSQKSYFYGKIAERMDDDRLNQEMAGTNTLYLLLTKIGSGPVLSSEVIQGLDRIQTMVAQDADVGKSVSPADLARSIHWISHGGHSGDYRLPNDSNELNTYIQALGARSEQIPGLSADGSQALLQIFLKRDNTQFVDDLAGKIRTTAREVFPSDIDIKVGGGTTGGVALNEVMIREKVLNIVQIMGAVFIVSSLVFRSITAGVLILIPLFAALLANFGLMGWLGIPLQIATALVSAMAVGIGADYGIYLSYRIREELKKPGVAESDAILRAYRSAGKATLFVSSAVAGGFGLLMSSWGFMVHIWMGFLIALAMIVSAVSALTVFVALILRFRPKFIFGSRL